MVDELNILELYLKLEKARFDELLNYKIDVEANVDFENLLIPSMLIQPYIENAIIQALAAKGTGGKVKINIKKFNEFIICTVEDDGIGIEKAMELKSRKQIKSSSKGMSITKSRLELLNKHRSETSFSIYFKEISPPPSPLSATMIKSITRIKNFSPS